MANQILEPTHLSLFALARNTGLAISRMPVYAEVVVTARAPVELPPGNVDQRLGDSIVQAIRDNDPKCFASIPCRDRLQEALRQALSRLLTSEARDRLIQGNAATSAIGKILRGALEIAGTDTLGNLDSDALLLDLRDAIRSFANANGLALVQPEAPDTLMVWAHPLGILATDHVGYLSFDLSRLPPDVHEAVMKAVEARRQNPPAASDVSIWIYPMGLERFRVDALSQGRIAHDAVLVKLDLEPPDLPEVVKNLGLLAMQSPSLTDWRLSPGSFAINPAGLIGDSGCETLLPANVALQEFYFYQVVRLNDMQAGIPASLRPTVKAGIIHEYRVAWYPLGHSLGQILYSLPLAPGESVNLAVIDWTRRDDAQRTEHTTMDEQLVHNEHRDRTITETTDAAIQEYQKGSSFMAGLAASVGATAALGAGAGLAAGLAGSLGGSSADSSGSRNIAGKTVQNLSDNISQASASKRELQSTVVVHSVQAEHEAIETRTVVNYNHSHAMTMLYYEVLRHFRVVTERTRTSAAVLVHYPLAPFSVTVDQKLPSGTVHVRLYTDLLRDNRSLLRASLLDPKYAAGFDALERIEQRDKAAAHASSTAPPNPGDVGLVYFTLKIHTGGVSDARVALYGALYDGPNQLVNLVTTNLSPPGGNIHNLQSWGSFADANHDYEFFAVTEDKLPRKWSQIRAIRVGFPGVDKDQGLGITHISVDGSDLNGNIVENLAVWDGDYFLKGATDLVLETKHPAPPPAPPSRSADEINDQAALDELLDHLERHKEYYNRVIWLSEDPLARASRFDAMAWDGSSTALDHLENRAVEIIGSWVAFPTAETDLTDAVQALEADAARNLEEPQELLTERLVTLPTRGVFAEAKLGHCNASEEIDNTRFWDWQTSPIPHWAPEIAPTTPVTPQPQQPDLQPTPFPQSLVNIVNPPSAPDPTGLAAAFGALATPNIFRDMSGLAQVGSLLQKLSDNSIGIAQASNQARQILGGGASSGAGAGGASTGAGAGGGSRAGGGGAAPMPPNEQHDRMQVVRNAVDQGNITPQEGNQKISKILDAGTPGAPAGQGDGKISLADNTPEARSFFPPDNYGGETVLTARGENLPASALTDVVFLDAEVPNGGSVTLRSIGSGMTRVTAKRPGVVPISAQFHPGAAAAGSPDATNVSVPLFVEVTGAAADLDAVFDAWHLTSRREELISRTVHELYTLQSAGNLRIQLTSPVYEASLPAQFAVGEDARDFLTRITLTNTSPSLESVQGQTDANYPASTSSKGTATIQLGRLGAWAAGVGASLTALVARLGAAPPDKAVEDFTVDFISRFLASLIVRVACLLIFGSGAAGALATFTELTGFELPAGSDPADPAAYVDRGLAAMSLRADTVEKLQERFPTPPQFK